MPLPPAIASRIGTSRFWTDYLGTTGPLDMEQRLVTHAIPLEVADGERIDFGLDSWLTYCTLHVDGAWLGRDGGDEQFPPYPDALRCIEVELIARAIAIRDPELDHPGPVAALLARFAPITDERDATHFLPVLANAFERLGVEMPAERYRFWDQGYTAAFDMRASKFRWVKRPRGYVLEQASKQRPPATVASLRVDGLARVFPGIDATVAADDYPELNGEAFPHAPLARVLEAARKTCEAAVARRDDQIRELARQAVRGERGARLVLGDALQDIAPDTIASDAIIRAVRRGDRWAAEVAAGVGPWELDAAATTDRAR